VPYVEALLKAGADPASTDEAGRNSLMLALEQGHEAAAEALLAPTSAVGAIDARGGEFERSALIEASAAGLTNMVEKLLALGAKPELTDKNGSNSLMWALCRKHEATAELLLEPIVAAGALDAQGARDQSALMWASASGLAGMVEKLLELGAKPDLKDAGGKTALDLANSAGHMACVAVLEQHAM
jgi:ankyrin repeat protein